MVTKPCALYKTWLENIYIFEQIVTKPCALYKHGQKTNLYSFKLFNCKTFNLYTSYDL